MRRIISALLGGVVLIGIALVAPSVAASAATANTATQVAQPPEAFVGHAYSYELHDDAGSPVKFAGTAGYYYGNGTSCPTEGYAGGLPEGLSFSSPGVISGTPTIPEQTQFCIYAGFEDGSVGVFTVTMKVGSGTATLDPILIAVDTDVEIAIQVALQASVDVPNDVGNLLSCVTDAGQPNPYCTLQFP